MSANLTPPPIGVTPRFVLDEKRLEELRGAIMRCVQDRYSFPREWLNEYCEVATRASSRGGTL